MGKLHDKDEAHAKTCEGAKRLIAEAEAAAAAGNAPPRPRTFLAFMGESQKRQSEAAQLRQLLQQAKSEVDAQAVKSSTSFRAVATQWPHQTPENGGSRRERSCPRPKPRAAQQQPGGRT